MQLLYFDGCPNWIIMKQRLTEALAIIGHPDVPIALTRLQSPEDAQANQFVGSPTLRIGGQDPFFESGAAVGLACRVYSTPDGLDGSPTVEQLVDALRRAS